LATKNIGFGIKLGFGGGRGGGARFFSGAGLLAIVDAFRSPLDDGVDLNPFDGAGGLRDPFVPGLGEYAGGGGGGGFGNDVVEELGDPEGLREVVVEASELDDFRENRLGFVGGPLIGVFAVFPSFME
jgi:hypothetical protein